MHLNSQNFFNMIKLNSDSIIYIDSPSNIYTGGPLALHQLAYKLKIKGFNVLMFYNNTKEIHPNFLTYNIPFVTKIEDRKNNVIIVPETNTNEIYKYNNIRKCIWWLSIDNFYSIRKIERLKILLGIKRRYSFEKKMLIYHLTQSFYAFNFLTKKKKIESDKIKMLSDYLLPIFLKNEIKTERKDIILYNPKKGLRFTKKIINYNIQYEWVPLINLSAFEVKNLLNTAKLYIDFGNHPGRDRFPREAAICGCCVITNKKGSAFYYEDVPILDEFKFYENKIYIPEISKKIHQIMSDYKTNYDKFSEYIYFINANETIFENEITSIFS